MSRKTARQIAIDCPDTRILGTKKLHTILSRRALYPEARVRELAHTIVGDRTFADFAPGPQSGRPPHETPSSLLIPVFSARHGTPVLPRDLPKLGLSDLRVADALVAATRIPGAFPAAEGLEDIFDDGCRYRVLHDIFTPNRSLILDLYGPQPYDSRGGLLFPLLHTSLPFVGHRPPPLPGRKSARLDHLRPSTLWRRPQCAHPIPGRAFRHRLHHRRPLGALTQ